MFDDDPMPATGGGFRLPGIPAGLGRLLGGFFEKPDRRAELQAALLEIELRERLGQGVVAYQPASVEQATQERADWVVMGPRGSGKTASAILIAREQARSLGWQVRGVEFPRTVCGVEPISWGEAMKTDRVVLVMDEHRILSIKPDALWSALALARHRQRAFVMTAQSTAAIPPDVWRLGVVAGWKGIDLLGLGFEREELQSRARQAAAVLAAGVAPRAMAATDGRGWLLFDLSLPGGWTDADSLLWRGA
jgi:hypothetical protein